MRKYINLKCLLEVGDVPRTKLKLYERCFSSPTYYAVHIWPQVVFLTKEKKMIATCHTDSRHDHAPYCAHMFKFLCIYKHVCECVCVPLNCVGVFSSPHHCHSPRNALYYECLFVFWFISELIIPKYVFITLCSVNLSCLLYYRVFTYFIRKTSYIQTFRIRSHLPAKFDSSVVTLVARFESEAACL